MNAAIEFLVVDLVYTDFLVEQGFVATRSWTQRPLSYGTGYELILVFRNFTEKWILTINGFSKKWSKNHSWYDPGYNKGVLLSNSRISNS